MSLVRLPHSRSLLARSLTEARDVQARLAKVSLSKRARCLGALSIDGSPRLHLHLDVFQ